MKVNHLLTITRFRMNVGGNKIKMVYWMFFKDCPQLDTYLINSNGSISHIGQYDPTYDNIKYRDDLLYESIDAHIYIYGK